MNENLQPRIMRFFAERRAVTVRTRSDFLGSVVKMQYLIYSFLFLLERNALRCTLTPKP